MLLDITRKEVAIVSLFSGFEFLQKKLDIKIKKFKFRKYGNNLKFKLRSYLKIEGDIREIKYECICLF